jgi:hypothetical protein
MYSDKGELETVFKLYAMVKKDNLEPSFYCMNHYLESSMKMRDNDRILEVILDHKKQSN